MHPLEERISHQFRNPQLLTEALTHPSVRHEKQRAHFDNQRLEYLGDAVLQLVISEHLFRLFTDAGEGRLTTRRARLVSRGSLQARAVRLHPGRYLLVGAGHDTSGGRERTTLRDSRRITSTWRGSPSGPASSRARALGSMSASETVRPSASDTAFWATPTTSPLCVPPPRSAAPPTRAATGMPVTRQPNRSGACPVLWALAVATGGAAIRKGFRWLLRFSQRSRFLVRWSRKARRSGFPA